MTAPKRSWFAVTVDEISIRTATLNVEGWSAEDASSSVAQSLPLIDPPWVKTGKPTQKVTAAAPLAGHLLEEATWRALDRLRGLGLVPLPGRWRLYRDDMVGSWYWEHGVYRLTVYATPWWEGCDGIPVQVLTDDGGELALGFTIPFKQGSDSPDGHARIYIALMSEALKGLEVIAKHMAVPRTPSAEVPPDVGAPNSEHAKRSASDVAAEAREAFWERVATAYGPEAESGDLPPDVTARFDRVTDEAVHTWSLLNVPAKEK